MIPSTKITFRVEKPCPQRFVLGIPVVFDAALFGHGHGIVVGIYKAPADGWLAEGVFVEVEVAA